jgi:large subunit ribosomal protein L22
MEAIAKAKYLKGSPRKARLVIDLVRGKNVSHALAILKFTNKRAADPIAKCIRSAVANATYKAEQENIAIDPDDLWIKSCFVDMGPTKNRRRLRPAPQGRAFFERRHFCHITIELTSDAPEQKEEPVKAKSGSKKKAGTKASKVTAKAKTSEKAKKAEKAEEPAAEAKAEKAPAKPKAEKKPAAKKAADKAPAEKKESDAAEKKEAKTEAPAAKEEKKSKDAKKEEASTEEE